MLLTKRMNIKFMSKLIERIAFFLCQIKSIHLHAEQNSCRLNKSVAHMSKEKKKLQSKTIEVSTQLKN